MFVVCDVFQEEPIAKKLKTGHKLSDTVYQGQLKISKL